MKEKLAGKARSEKQISRRAWLSKAAGAAAVAPALARVGFPLPVRAASLADIQLSMGLSGSARERPIVDGRVKPQGVDLTVTTVGVSELFWRQLHFAEFDVAEMSCSSFVISVSRGDRRFVGIPVFPTRNFFHTRVVVREGAGIERPEDLKGKRVGVPEYQQTAALWARFGLQHEYGVTAQDLDWHMERPPESSHGGATGFQAPQGVKFQYIPAGKSITSMLRAGELDAAFPTYNAGNTPGVRLLFRDRVAEAARYYKKTGFFPMNHCVVIKREIAERHPWVVMNLYHAFNEAKNMVNEQAREVAASYFELDLIPRDRISVLQQDPYVYGMKANQTLLEGLTRASFEQGLTPRVIDLKDVFHPATMDDPA
jgi:4,5-dihydroxyphthalate decarboxylase